MPVDLEGLRSLIEEYLRQSLSTARVYANQLSPGEFVQERDWPRAAEGDMIERLLAEAHEERFGGLPAPAGLLMAREEFLRTHGYSAAPMTSAADFAKAFNGRALWAQNALDAVRYLKHASAAPDVVTTVLFLSASPTNEVPLRLDEELREIREEIERAKLRNTIRLESRGAVRATDLSRFLLDLTPRMVHFSGHGGVTGAIFLEDENAQSHEVEPEALAALFGLLKPPPLCVVLNACYSVTQAQALSQHVRYVVGMSDAIQDRAAIKYAAAFYRAFAAGTTIEDAHKFGIVELKLHKLADQLPVLIGPSPIV